MGFCSERAVAGLGPSGLRTCSCVSGEDDFKAYRYSSDKTLAWLQMKVVIAHFICSDCAIYG